MDVNLVIEGIIAVSELGIIGWIFHAGLWKGTVDTKLKELGRGQEDQRALVRQGGEDNDHSLEELGRRVEVLANSGQELGGRVGALLAGLQAQRQEWDQLRSDVRSLLHAEAVTTTTVNDIKTRFAAFGEQVQALGRDLARFEADISHMRSDLDQVRRNQ